MKTMKWGILGLGGVAREFAEGANTRQGIYACAARDLSRAEAFAAEYGIKKAYGSYEELLNDPEIDSVYIATVNSTHIELMNAAIEHGKNVLCEKALCTDIAEYRRLQTKAEEHHVYLAEAMTIYHMPLYLEIKKLISEGKIGKIKFVEAELGSLKDDKGDNRFFKKEVGGGAMGDIGIYVLSFVNFFLEGNVDNVQHTMTLYEPNGVDEMWAMSLHTDKDEIGSANITYRCKLPKRAIIGGEDGYFLINDYPRADKAELVYPDGTKYSVEAGSTALAFAYEMEHMDTAVCEKNPDILYCSKTETVIEQMDHMLRAEDLPTK